MTILRINLEKIIKKDSALIIWVCCPFLWSAEGAEDGENVIIALIDVDNFGHANKEFGRAVGDKVLIDTRLFVKERIPGDAMVYRMACR